MWFSLVIAIVLTANVDAYFGTGSKCPYDWDYFKGDETCVRVFARVGWYGGAEQKCEGYGGRIAKIMSKAKNDFVYGLARWVFQVKNIWIDIHCDSPQEDTAVDEMTVNVEGDLISNGPEGISNTTGESQPMAYSNWYGGIPSDRDEEDKCVYMHTVYDRQYAGKWTYTSCRNPRNYVCELPARGFACHKC